MVITLMTRMQHGTDSVLGKIAAAVAGAFLLAGLQMFHSILDSLLIFGAMIAGDAPFGYLDWLQWFGYTVVGNIVGGLGLVTLLRLLRSRTGCSRNAARRSRTSFLREKTGNRLLNASEGDSASARARPVTHYPRSHERRGGAGAGGSPVGPVRSRGPGPHRIGVGRSGPA